MPAKEMTQTAVAPQAMPAQSPEAGPELYRHEHADGRIRETTATEAIKVCPVLSAMSVEQALNMLEVSKAGQEIMNRAAEQAEEILAEADLDGDDLFNFDFNSGEDDKPDRETASLKADEAAKNILSTTQTETDETVEPLPGLDMEPDYSAAAEAERILAEEQAAREAEQQRINAENLRVRLAAETEQTAQAEQQPATAELEDAAGRPEADDDIPAVEEAAAEEPVLEEVLEPEPILDEPAQPVGAEAGTKKPPKPADQNTSAEGLDDSGGEDTAGQPEETDREIIPPPKAVDRLAVPISIEGVEPADRLTALDSRRLFGAGAETEGDEPAEPEGDVVMADEALLEIENTNTALGNAKKSELYTSEDITDDSEEEFAVPEIAEAVEAIESAMRELDNLETGTIDTTGTDKLGAEETDENPEPAKELALNVAKTIESLDGIDPDDAEELALVQEQLEEDFSRFFESINVEIDERHVKQLAYLYITDEELRLPKPEAGHSTNHSAYEILHHFKTALVKAGKKISLIYALLGFFTVQKSFLN